MTFIKSFYNALIFNKSLLDFKKYNKMQSNMGPIRYGVGQMIVPLKSIYTLFTGKGILCGHSGSTGSFAFYYPNKNMFICGNFTQLAYPALPIAFCLKSVLKTK